jgi:hypothetical protein
MWIRVSECVAAYLLLLTCVCSAQVTTAAGWMEKGNRELDEGQFTRLSFKDSAKGRWVRLDLSNSVSR